MKRRLVRLGIGLLVALLLFEEGLWSALGAIGRRLSPWLPLRALAVGLGRLPPWAAVGVMVLPALVLLPVKLLAVWALGQGHPWLGLATLIGAKLAGTASAAWLFDCVRDSARRLAWFDALYRRITGWPGPTPGCAARPFTSASRSAYRFGVGCHGATGPGAGCANTAAS